MHRAERAVVAAIIGNLRPTMMPMLGPPPPPPPCPLLLVAAVVVVVVVVFVSELFVAVVTLAVLPGAGGVTGRLAATGAGDGRTGGDISTGAGTA
jgi:hypothetical protein